MRYAVVDCFALAEADEPWLPWNRMNPCMFQIPDVKIGNDRIDAVVVDEESVGTANAPGCGGKILRGEGALEGYLAETKLKNSAVWIHM